MNLKGELLKRAKKDQDRTAISGIIMKTFPDTKGWLDIKKNFRKNQKEIKAGGPSTFLGIFILRVSERTFQQLVQDIGSQRNFGSALTFIIWLHLLGYGQGGTRHWVTPSYVNTCDCL